MRHGWLALDAGRTGLQPFWTTPSSTTAENGSVVALLEENADGSRSLTVSDTGVWASTPSDQEHVFERFFRGDRSRSSEGGTGLGLSIVKHAALAHGAKVSLSSKVGKGTSIRVDFPA